MTRVEVLSGPEGRRWSAEQKRSIVAEAFAPGASACEVARRMDVVAGRFMAVGAICGRPRRGLPRSSWPRGWSSERVSGLPALEIELGREIRVRIAATAPKELASAIIKALLAR